MGLMVSWIWPTLLEEGFSARLKEGVFESVKITVSGALEWLGDLDLCPDSIYMRLTGKTPEEVFPILKNHLAYA